MGNTLSNDNTGYSIPSWKMGKKRRKKCFEQELKIELTLSTSAPFPHTLAMYCIITLDASVLPAPDSPVMITHCRHQEEG